MVRVLCLPLAWLDAHLGERHLRNRDEPLCQGQGFNPGEILGVCECAKVSRIQ